MAEIEPTWASPVWNPYSRQHRVERGVRWGKVIEETKTGKAKYAPHITDPLQMELELRCIREGRLVHTRGANRWYYLDVGEMIGASSGVETKYVYVQYDTLRGDVHGRPISLRELHALGVGV